MKVGLIYWTKTGHSKKIAEAVAQDLQIEAVDIQTKPKLENIDLLYIISGIYGGKSSPDLIEFVKTITGEQVKKAVIMTSSCGNKTLQNELREILIKNGVQVAKDEFTCKGGFLFIRRAHPNEEDVQSAKEFAKKALNN